MSEISKPDYQYLWSSGGSVVAPSNVKIQTGWTAEVPPFQWENWSQNRQDQAIAHVLQHGISVWDAATEYQAGKSYVTGSNGRIYVAIQTNTNQNPVTDTSEVYWTTTLTQKVAVFATPGSSSWTIPLVLKNGTTNAYVTVIGAGGGGGMSILGNAGSGGGGGGIVEALVNLTGITSVNVTIGTGGTTGTNGGGSSFGATASAIGGSGATGGASPVPGVGGSGIGSESFRVNTLGGGHQRILQLGGAVTSGRGGGDGGGQLIEAASGEVLAGQNAVSSGCGGGGGTNGGAGGSGANGIVIVRW